MIKDFCCDLSNTPVTRRRRRRFLLRFLFDYGGIWDAGGRISTILLDQKVQHNYGSMTVLLHVLSQCRGPVVNLSHLHNPLRRHLVRKFHSRGSENVARASTVLHPAIIPLVAS